MTVKSASRQAARVFTRRAAATRFELGELRAKPMQIIGAPRQPKQGADQIGRQDALGAREPRRSGAPR
jgi:hypothetical protein